MALILPLVIAIVYGLVQWHFSALRLKARLDAQSRRLDDPEIGAMAAKMAAALGVQEVRVDVLDEAAINGLAAPDGRIFLTAGFIEAYRRGAVTAAEIASVIAHELGHVALGHSKRRMIDFTGQNALLAIARPILHRMLPGIGGPLAGLLARAFAAKLSRRDEHEADAYASALLVKSGIGTEAQKSLFAKLDTLTGARGTGAAWMLSHPPTPERIRAIERREDRWR